MKKYVLILCILHLSYSLYSQHIQSVPDYEKISKEIINKDSKFYYPPLLERYLKNDTTLTEEDFHYLYFGYIFQDKYNPYNYDDSVQIFFKRLNKQILDKEDYSFLLSCALGIMDRDPFNIRILKMVAYIYNQQGNTEMAWRVGRKNAFLLGAIMSSGDGYSDSTAIHVISVSHEYEIMALLQLKFKSQALTHYKNQAIDAMSVETKDHDSDTIYFNVTQIFNSNRKILFPQSK